MNREPRKNPARWVAAAISAPASIALFGATMSWAAHATPVTAAPTTVSAVTPATSSPAVPNEPGTSTDPLVAQLEAQIAANDARLTAQQQELDNLYAQIAAIQGQPAPKKSTTSTTQPAAPQQPTQAAPAPAPAAPPATNTTTGGSGK